jgi:hypothetical protein
MHVKKIPDALQLQGFFHGACPLVDGNLGRMWPLNVALS